MPRHARPSAPALVLPSTTYGHHNYLQNSKYGLVEPFSLVIPNQVQRHPLHKRSSSSGSSPIWNEWDFDFGELKEKSLGIGAEIGEKIGDKIPGVRYSATFLSSLRTNLALSTSLAPPSPNLLATSPRFIPSIKSSSSKLVMSSQSIDPIQSSRPSELRPYNDGVLDMPPIPDRLANIPPLTFTTTSQASDRTTALKLIADSVAQQRQRASRILIFHPLTISILSILFYAIYAKLYKVRGDLPLVGTTCAGLVMIMLVAVRAIVSPYLTLAERIGWDWLGNDEVMIAKFGSDIIGAAVFRVETETESGGSPRKKNKPKVGIIRAWTIRLRERGRGVGKGLMENVVEECVSRGADSVKFESGEGRAVVERVLPDGGPLLAFNRDFNRWEERAKEDLWRMVVGAKSVDANEKTGRKERGLDSSGKKARKRWSK